MHTVEEIAFSAMTLAGRGDKPSPDDLNQTIRVMNMILKDWATTRDVHLWNLLEETISVTRASIVTHLGNQYLCYASHIASTTNEPGVGAEWPNYWVGANSSESIAEWVSGTTYGANQNIALNPFQLEDITAVRLLHEGQFSPVEKINMHEYALLDPAMHGLPEKIYVEKRANETHINIWPKCGVSNASLIYYRINRPEDVYAGQTLLISDAWIMALQYALAVEMGFMYNISIERLNILGQKAHMEFNKAFRLNESEVDRCFVKPCY
jgi:hypothetical protein